jgi:hypothetical protein
MMPPDPTGRFAKGDPTFGRPLAGSAGEQAVRLSGATGGRIE